MRNSKDIEKKGLETGNSLHRGPRWGTWRGFVYGDLLGDRLRALETEHLLSILLI